MCRKCELDARITGDPDDPVVVQQWLEQEHARLREIVRRCGWAIEYVEESPPQQPAFGYTVGLMGFGHPELLVFGTCPRTTSGVLNSLGKRVRDGGRLVAGDVVDVLGTPVQFFDVPNPHEILFAADMLYRYSAECGVSALQVVYPDADGTWPWEPGCRLPRDQQPMPGQFRAGR
jgi:hypothetical protein